MANALNVTSLTLNAQEAQSVSEFIMSRTIASPAVESYATIWDGIKMNTQVVIAGNLGLAGLKSASCGRMASGAESVLSEAFLNPVNISDTFALYGDDIDAEFKPYKNKIAKYKELYDLTGSDAQLLLAAKVEGAIQPTFDRLIWCSETAITGATSGTSGLVAGVGAEFYNYTDGLWKQITAGVGTGATDIKRYTIANNAQTTATGQTLTAGQSKTIFNGVLANASTALRQATDKVLLVSREVFDNYVDALIAAGENSSIDYTVEGIATVKYKGIQVINMEGAWVGFENIIQNTVTGLPLNPNKVILTVPSNIAIGTLDKGGINELDTHFDWLSKKTYVAFGFTAHGVITEKTMISVAY